MTEAEVFCGPRDRVIDRRIRWNLQQPRVLLDSVIAGVAHRRRPVACRVDVDIRVCLVLPAFTEVRRRSVVRRHACALTRCACVAAGHAGLVVQHAALRQRPDRIFRRAHLFFDVARQLLVDPIIHRLSRSHALLLGLEPCADRSVRGDVWVQRQGFVYPCDTLRRLFADNRRAQPAQRTLRRTRQPLPTLRLHHVAHRCEGVGHADVAGRGLHALQHLGRVERGVQTLARRAQTLRGERRDDAGDDLADGVALVAYHAVVLQLLPDPLAAADRTALVVQHARSGLRARTLQRLERLVADAVLRHEVRDVDRTADGSRTDTAAEHVTQVVEQTVFFLRRHHFLPQAHARICARPPRLKPCAASRGNVAYDRRLAPAGAPFSPVLR